MIFTNMEESRGLALILHSRIVFHLSLYNIAPFGGTGYIFSYYLLS